MPVIENISTISSTEDVHRMFDRMTFDPLMMICEAVADHVNVGRAVPLPNPMIVMFDVLIVSHAAVLTVSACPAAMKTRSPDTASAIAAARVVFALAGVAPSPELLVASEALLTYQSLPNCCAFRMPASSAGI